MSKVRFTSFPTTKAPPGFVSQVVDVFRAHEPTICTLSLDKGLKSDEVLAELALDLKQLGFDVELGKRNDEKVRRPVFFGENGRPRLEYQVDAFHPQWRCGLEVEAGRAMQGNAVYKDLVQALVMVDLDALLLAVPNSYKYGTTSSDAYTWACKVAGALYGHGRIKMPYDLVVIGY